MLIYQLQCKCSIHLYWTYSGTLVLQVTHVGVVTSASCLLSLIIHQFLDTAGRRDTIRGLTALAQACSHLSSMSFTGSLLAACGEPLLSSTETRGPYFSLACDDLTLCAMV